MVFGGPVLWKMNKAAKVLRWYREFLPKAPEDLYGFFAFLKVPPGPPFPEPLHTETMCGIVWCMLDRLKKQKRFTNPFANFSPDFAFWCHALHPAKPFRWIATARIAVVWKGFRQR
jgi:hypothetical protein